jgi:hypothetical protein
MVDSLAGGIRSRNDAAANQSITGAARRMGGDTTSPAFAFLSQMAKTGAAGKTGSEIAGLKFSAAESGAARELQRQQANQSAAMQAQSIANQFALGTGNQGLEARGQDIQNNQFGQNLEQQKTQFAAQNLIERAKALSSVGPYTEMGRNATAALGFGKYGKFPNFAMA